ncbi:MAG: ATP-binding protein [Parcubacteria group bacterium]
MFLVLFVSSLFTLTIFFTSRVFQELSGAQFLITILASFVVVLGLDPLKRFIGAQTDRFFFKAPIDYQDILARFSEKTSLEIELDALVVGLPADLAKDLKLKHVEILLADDDRNLCRRDPVTNHLSVCFANATPLVEHITKPGETIDCDGLERKIEDTHDGPEKEKLKRSLEQLQEVDAYYVAPITSQNKLNAALVLGQKLSGDAFSVEELRLFKVLGPQIGSAIEKAKLFDEVKHFSQKLQIEVDRATKELKERNRFLLALQEMTSLITHSLDYAKVTQEIVDGIARKLGYIGGILMQYDRKSGKTWAQAITNTALTRMAFKLLPKPLSEYAGSINDPDKATLAMRTGERQESSRLADFLDPPIPSPICSAIQKMTHIQNVVAEPISSESEIIGALVFVIGKKVGDITQQERAMMKALADQAGIVIHNLQLFDAIQKANAELETANAHLRSLDEAKSEFISIASHQLRTPMTGIMGYLSMLVSGDFGKTDPKITKVLDGILGASKRMIRLINIFLNITKIEAGKFEISKKPTQIAEVIETEFIELSKLAKDKGLTLTFKQPKPALPEANVDRDKLADVIQNLVDNAIKYTEKGKVTVTASVEDGNVRVAVKDTGRGLKQEEAEKLFNKFVRGDGIARIHPDGSGLGLYIAKKIVESHGGKIWVESEGEGKGSTFTFEVPIDGGESASVDKPT